MFGNDVIKNYYVIHFNFIDGIEKYFVYKYTRNRKLTTRQMWLLVAHKEYDYELICEGKAINIVQFNSIVTDLKLPINRCHRLITFNCIS